MMDEEHLKQSLCEMKCRIEELEKALCNAREEIDSLVLQKKFLEGQIEAYKDVIYAKLH